MTDNAATNHHGQQQNVGGPLYPELRPNRSLLDAKFEGYKLALDQLPIAELPLPTPVDNPQLTERQFSFDHLKAYGVLNHLYLDPWDLDCAYYVDTDWQITRVRIVVDSNPDPPRGVLRLPNASDRRLSAGRCHPSLAFADDSMACVADGSGRLFFVDTGGDRGAMTRSGGGGDREWEILGTFDCEPGVLSYAVRQTTSTQGGGQQPMLLLRCLMMRIREAEKASGSSDTTKEDQGFRCVLDWLTFEPDDTESSGFRLARRRTLESASVPNYAYLDADCRHLLLQSDRPFEFVKPSGSVDGTTSNSVSAAAAATASSSNPKSMASESSPAPYSWSQTADSVTAFVPLPAGVAANFSDVLLENTGARLRVFVRDCRVLDGQLYEPVDKESCTWTVDAERRLLEIHLLGKRTPVWPCLVTNDSRGILLPDPDAAADMAAAISASGEHCDRLYNSQELEECDFPDTGGDEDAGTNAALVWIDVEEEKVVAHTALDSAQWLFSARINPGEPPYACLRRDVDGLVWRADARADAGAKAILAWEHVATFHAFGYVRASKTDAKFVSCPPSFGYCAVCDCYRHVYVYHSPRPVTTELRNRRSGQVVAERATQQVASLATQDQLIGFACCDSRILALTERTLYVLRVKAA